MPQAEVDAGPAVPDRRLHRLLHRHPPRHCGRQAVPARQPAAAELQVGADRLSRPRVVDQRERPALSPSAWARPRPPMPTRRRSAPTRGSTTSWSSASSSAGRTWSASRSRWPRPKTMCSASRCSTTGARATSSRWEYQPLGPVPVEELRHHAVAVGRHAGRAGAVPQALRAARRRSRSRCRIWIRRPTANAARSTSSSRSGCRQRRCARPAMQATLIARSNFADALLDRRAARRAPHRQRLQPANRRSVRLRHAVGPAAGAGRLAARAHAGRQAADPSGERRDAHLPAKTATR